MRFEIYDTRTGKAIAASFMTAEYAQTVIRRAAAHQARGNRMDLEGIEFWSVRPMSDPSAKV
jgi:hypothetical protein